MTEQSQDTPAEESQDTEAGGEGTVAIDPAQVDEQEFARNLSKVPDEELREGMSGPMRDQILDEIFSRMEQHYTGSGGVDAVIHWRIGGRSDGGYDEFEVVLKGGECTAKRGFESDPRVSLQLDGVDFLRLVTGNVAGPQLFMTGKLKIEGDLMFSASVAGMFKIPA